MRILVLCTGNSCRSQMAEGYLRHFAGDKVEVFSAGVETHGLNPKAVAAMQEDGVDISSHTSKTIDAFQGRAFDLILTVCDSARENCPWFPAKAEHLHRDFPDPAMALGTETEVMDAFRKVRDQIKAFCKDLIGKP